MNKWQYDCNRNAPTDKKESSYIYIYTIAIPIGLSTATHIQVVYQ